MFKTCCLIVGIFVLALVSADESAETSSSDPTSVIPEAIKTTVVPAEISETNPPEVQSTIVPITEPSSAAVTKSTSNIIEELSVQENPVTNTEPQPAAPIVTITASESVQDILTTILTTKNEVKPSVKSGQNSVNQLPAGTVSTIVNSAADVKSHLPSIFLTFIFILLLI